MKTTFENLSGNIYWNLFLITLGCCIYAIGVNGIAYHHEFVVGGIYGLSLLLNYVNPAITPWISYMLFNMIIFFIGYKLVSRKFFLYSAYGAICVTVFTATIKIVIPIEDTMLAAIATGVLYGAGTGITLRSLGSTGGLDIIAIILNLKWNVRIGMTASAFNFILFAISMLFLNLDRILFSMFFCSHRLWSWSIYSAFPTKEKPYLLFPTRWTRYPRR